MDLLAAGLGLDYGSVRCAPTTRAWIAAGIDVATAVAQCVDGTGATVEIIGSSAVEGLLAKPVIDLAVGLPAAEPPVDPVATRLERAGWIYRGDAGDQGGRVFVLEARPWFRVAHLHVVDRDGVPWRDYLRLRETLRTSAEARRQYAAVKLELIEQHAQDHRAYTDGKSAVVAALLRGSA